MVAHSQAHGAEGGGWPFSGNGPFTGQPCLLTCANTHYTGRIGF